MFKLKGKTIWLFTLIVIGLASVGAYFYTSLTSLNEQVEAGVYPQKRSNYLKNITLDINKLSNLYLVDSITYSRERVDTLLFDIEKNIDSLKFELDAATNINSNMLDTIPVLLRNVQEEYIALSQVKVRSQIQFNADLERVMVEELTALNLSDKDSVTIVKQITSKIHERVENKTPDPEVTDEKGKKKSFLQRLFGSSSDDKATTEKKVTDSLASEPLKISQDTIISTSIDTLQTTNGAKESTELKILTVLDEIQQKRIRNLERLKSRETQIFQKNNEVNNYIESILNVILFEEVNAFNTSIEDFNKKSKSYLWKTGLIILVILTLGIVSIWVIIKDINKSIFYQEKLKDSERKALREADEKQKFLSMMSHEIRTPLTSIIGYTELLNEKDEHVKAIKTASNYLYHMTNEILDMAKIKAGIIEVKEEPIILNEVVQQIQSNFEPLIQKQDITPLFEIPEEPIYIYSDQYRIQQILYNLVHNALKFTDDGFIKVGLIAPAEEGDRVKVQLVVKDSGSGMSADEKHRIFEDFQQAGTHKNKMKGTGLGLGIVKSLVQKLGGNIELKSELHKGSTFQMTFLFKKAEAHDIPKTNIIEEPGPEALKDYSVFVIDDDPLITRLYHNIFSKYGARITTMNEPVEALEHLSTHNYDLAIFDMKMPGISGSELLNRLIEKGKKPDNVVVCTANVLLSKEDELSFDKFDYQLFKPLVQQDLIRLIYRVFKLEKPATIARTTTIKLTSQPEQENTGVAHSLDGLKAYTETQVELMEMLGFLLKENSKELEALNQAIMQQDSDEIAHRIHKLSSRFSQLKIVPPFEPGTIELTFKKGRLTQLDDVKKLYDYWCFTHQFLIDTYPDALSDS